MPWNLRAGPVITDLIRQEVDESKRIGHHDDTWIAKMVHQLITKNTTLINFDL